MGQRNTRKRAVESLSREMKTRNQRIAADASSLKSCLLETAAQPSTLVVAILLGAVVGHATHATNEGAARHSRSQSTPSSDEDQPKHPVRGAVTALRLASMIPSAFTLFNSLHPKMSGGEVVDSLGGAGAASDPSGTL